MSKTKAAISGDFASYRPVMSRKILQIIVEVPIEAQQAVFEALGFPIGGGSIPVAIARLNGPDKEPDEASAESAKSKHAPAIQQAGIVCKEPAFWAFLGERFRCIINNESLAAHYVRLYCNVNSRADIVPGSIAQHRWNKLFLDYGEWRHRHAR